MQTPEPKGGLGVSQSKCLSYTEWRKTLDVSRKQWDLKLHKLLDIKSFDFMAYERILN